MFATAALIACLSAPACDAPAKLQPKKPELAFVQDGDDLVISTTITINGADHVLITWFDDTDAGTPGLRYTVIQNADRLVRCQKEITVVWRLKGQVKQSGPYTVTPRILQLSTAELKGFGGEVAKLAAPQVD